MHQNIPKEAYLSLILQYFYDAVIVTDLKFHITSWNLAAERIYGYKAEEALGSSTIDVLKTIFAEGVTGEKYRPATGIRNLARRGVPT